MSQLEFLTILQKTLVLVLQISAPVLIISMVIGFAISVFQSVTQIQEATITFVPKILACILTIIFFAPWMLEVFMNGVNEIFASIPSYIH